MTLKRTGHPATDNCMVKFGQNEGSTPSASTLLKMEILKYGNMEVLKDGKECRGGCESARRCINGLYCMRMGQYVEHMDEAPCRQLRIKN